MKVFTGITTKKPTICYKWVSFDGSILKLNTDNAINLARNMVSVVSILHDLYGAVYLVATIPIVGLKTMLVAKLRIVFEELYITMNVGFKRVIVETYYITTILFL